MEKAESVGKTPPVDREKLAGAGILVFDTYIDAAAMALKAGIITHEAAVGVRDAAWAAFNKLSWIPASDAAAVAAGDRVIDGEAPKRTSSLWSRIKSLRGAPVLPASPIVPDPGVVGTDGDDALPVNGDGAAGAQSTPTLLIPAAMKTLSYLRSVNLQVATTRLGTLLMDS